MMTLRELMDNVGINAPLVTLESDTGDFLNEFEPLTDWETMRTYYGDTIAVSLDSEDENLIITVEI